VELLLGCYGVPLAESITVTTEDTAVAAAARFSGPVTLATASLSRSAAGPERPGGEEPGPRTRARPGGHSGRAGLPPQCARGGTFSPFIRKESGWSRAPWPMVTP
jgi:hypothetical protein